MSPVTRILRTLGQVLAAGVLIVPALVALLATVVLVAAGCSDDDAPAASEVSASFTCRTVTPWRASISPPTQSMKALVRSSPPQAPCSCRAIGRPSSSPTGTLIRSTIRVAPSTSSSVAGSRARISGNAGSLKK